MLPLAPADSPSASLYLWLQPLTRMVAPVLAVLDKFVHPEAVTRRSLLLLPLRVTLKLPL